MITSSPNTGGKNGFGSYHMVYLQVQRIGISEKIVLNHDETDNLHDLI